MTKPNLLDANPSDPLWKRLQARDLDLQFKAKHEVLLMHDPMRAAKISQCSVRYPCYDPDCGTCGHPSAGSGAMMRGTQPVSKASVGARHYKTNARRKMKHLAPGLVAPELSAVTINIAALDLAHPDLQDTFLKSMERFRDRLGKLCRRKAPGITLIGRIEVVVVEPTHLGVTMLPPEAKIGRPDASYFALVHAHMIAVHPEHNRSNEFGDHDVRKPTPRTDLVSLFGSAFPNREGGTFGRVDVRAIKNKVGPDGEDMYGAAGFLEYANKRETIYVFEKNNVWVAGRLAILRKGLTKRRDAVSVNKKGLVWYAYERDFASNLIQGASRGDPAALAYLGDAFLFNRNDHNPDMD